MTRANQRGRYRAPWLVGAVIAVAAAGALSGCGSASTSTSETSAEPSAATGAPTRGASGELQCPDLFAIEDLPDYTDYNSQYSVPVTFVNKSSIPLTVNASEIDCYDFSGTENPSIFDGAKIAVGASSGPYRLLARRTCPYVAGDVVGKFQEREARWKTTVSSQANSAITGTIPTVIDCSSFGQNPTMCASGASQDRASYTVKMTDGTVLRAKFVCNGTNTTITLSDLY